ncbi:MAG: hypothetical protein AABX17_01950 [Nanoarchaeota archaeon]
MKIKELKEKCCCCKRINATGLIRGKAVCAKCFNILNRDNYMRIRSGASIPSNLTVMFS